MKIRNALILLLVASLLLGCMAGCKTTPKPTDPTEATEDHQVQIPTITPDDPLPTEPEIIGVRAGDIYRINKLATANNGENGITFYYMDGNTLTPFSQYNAQAGLWQSDHAKVAPCTDVKHSFGQGEGQVIISFDVPATGAVEIHTNTELLTDKGYTVKLAQGSADNVVGSHEITGAAGTAYRYGYSLKVTEGEKLYLIYTPKEKDASFKFADFVVYTGVGAGAEPTTPVNAPLNQTGQNTQRVINFTDLVGKNNGMNGLTFYYTADGKNVTPLSSYDAAEGKWYKGGDGVLVYPCMVKKDNYGLFGSSAAEYIVMGYKLPATGTINLFAWAALQGEGIDYRVMVAKNSPDNIIEKFDVKGAAQTVEYRNIELTVKRGDVLYLHYKPLEKVNGAWGGYNTSITYLSGGADYQVFDPNGIDTGIVSGDSIPFTTLVEDGKNGENGLSWYYTADGATLTPFADYDAAEKKWYYGDMGTLIYPSLVPADNYGALGTSKTEYVALGYEIDKTGTIDLFTLVALQSGHDYQLRIAKNDPTKIIYAYNVEGAGGGVASIEKNTLINVSEGDVLYLLYKPLEVEDNAWCGFKVQLNWASVGKHIGPADPEPFIPDETVKPDEPLENIQVGSSLEFTKLASEENGANGLTFYYTTDGKELTKFTEHTGVGTEFRWYHGAGGLLVYPSFVPADNYGLVGASISQYVVMGLQIPETGTIDLFTWMALQSGHDFQVRIAKNDPTNILYTMDVRGESQTVVHQDIVMNVSKGDTLYLIYKPLEYVNGAWGGFINRVTYTAVGTQIGPADPEPIVPEDPGQPEIPEFADVNDGTMKILTIGNSFTVDTMEYVYKMAKSAGYGDLKLGKIVIGGATVDDHHANAISNAPAYEYGQSTDNGGWKTTYGNTMADVLCSDNWDYVMIQQNSTNSGVEASFSNLESLLDYISTYIHDDAKIIWNMTWAYQGDSTHEGFVQYGNDQMTMYNAIVSTAKKLLVPNQKIAKIVSTCTSIQNARTSYVGDTLTRDGYHLDMGRGRYVAAMAFVKMALDVDVNKVTYLPAGVSDAFRQAAVEAVNNAAAKPFEITASTFTADKVDASKDVIRDTWNFASMAGTTNGANGLTFYYTTDGKNLTPYVNYDAAQGRWYDNSASQLNMFDPAEVVKDNYGLGQCSVSKYIAMGYTAPETGSVDLFTLTGINGPEGNYRYSIRIAVGSPENVKYEYILEGEPGTSREERYTLEVQKGEQIFLIYQLTKNKAAGGWFGYKNSVTYRTAEKAGPEQPDTGVQVGDKLQSAVLAPVNANGENGMTLYYTADGKTLTPFSTYDPNNHGGRWYHIDGVMKTFVDPFVNKNDNYGWIGACQSEYVVMSYDMPASGKVSVSNWLALHTGHDCKILVAQGTPDNVVATFENKGGRDNVTYDTTQLTVTKGQKVYVAYQMLEAADNANTCYIGYKTEIVYEEVSAEREPAVSVGDKLQSALLAPVSENGENGMILYYTADGKTLTSFSTYDPNNHGGRWYHIDGVMKTFVDPFVNKNDNYGWIGYSQSEYVAMGYKMPEGGKVSISNWVALHTGHDCKILIAQGTPDNVVATFENKGGIDNVTYDTAQLTVARDQMVYVIFQPLEAAANANTCYLGYKTEIVYEEVDVSTQPEPEQPQHNVKVGDVFAFASLAGDKNGDNGLTFYYTADGKTLSPYTLFDKAMGRWYEVNNGALTWFDPKEIAADNYGQGMTSSAKHVVMGYEIPATGKVDLFLWSALHAGSGYKVSVAQGSLDNIVASYTFTTPNVGMAETYSLDVTAGQTLYFIYEAVSPANNQYFGYNIKLTYTEVQ